MRSIIGALFRKSPFEGLHKHMQKVRECCDQLQPLMEAFISGDRDLIRQKTKEISDLEHEADIIKNDIREHLPHRLLMSVDRSDILHFLNQEDAVADSIEDIARLIEMRETSVPSELKGELMELVDRVMNVITSLELATSEIKNLTQSSFSRKEEKKVSDLIKRIDRSEYEADIVQQRSARKLFSLEDKTDLLSMVLLMKIMGELGSVADHAQNTGDRLRGIIAR